MKCQREPGRMHFSNRQVRTKTTLESKAQRSFCRQTKKKKSVVSQPALVLASCYAGQYMRSLTTPADL